MQQRLARQGRQPQQVPHLDPVRRPVGFPLPWLLAREAAQTACRLHPTDEQPATGAVSELPSRPAGQPVAVLQPPGPAPSLLPAGGQGCAAAQGRRCASFLELEAVYDESPAAKAEQRRKLDFLMRALDNRADDLIATSYAGLVP